MSHTVFSKLFAAPPQPFLPLQLFSLVLHPPFPLQEFLPLQPLSPALQPPSPLHEFWPLQPCFPLSWSARLWSGEEAVPETLMAYDLTARDPVKRPATAAPVMIALDGNIVCLAFGWEYCVEDLS